MAASLESFGRTCSQALVSASFEASSSSAAATSFEAPLFSADKISSRVCCTRPPSPSASSAPMTKRAPTSFAPARIKTLE
jgi:hypothetical protein